MESQIDRRILEHDLFSRILDFELGAEAHIVADARIDEQVEALGDEASFVLEPIDSLQPRMRLGIAAKRGAAGKPSQMRLVEGTAAHERTVGCAKGIRRTSRRIGDLRIARR